LPPSSSTQFQLVTNDFVLADNNSLIGSNLELGASVKITLVHPKPFQVDDKGLVVLIRHFWEPRTLPFSLPARLLQCILSPSLQAPEPVSRLRRRFRVSPFHSRDGQCSQRSPSEYFYNAILSPVSWTGVSRDCTTFEWFPSTKFDGVTSASDLTSGQTASVRALYFGPPNGPTPTPSPLSAAKVRVPKVSLVLGR